jgi:hypothetical protein
MPLALNLNPLTFDLSKSDLTYSIYRNIAKPLQFHVVLTGASLYTQKRELEANDPFVTKLTLKLPACQ